MLHFFIAVFKSADKVNVILSIVSGDGFRDMITRNANVDAKHLLGKVCNELHIFSRQFNQRSLGAVRQSKYAYLFACNSRDATAR